MNKIYNQGLGRESFADQICCGITVANLHEAETGEVIKQEDIFAWYDSVGIVYDSTRYVQGGKWCAPSMRRVLTAMKTTPLGNARIKAFEQIWDVRSNPTPPLMVLWSKLKTGRFAFVIRTGCKLDEAYTLRPPVERKLNTHAVALASLSEGSKKFIIENSKGNKWGDKGFARINLLDLPQIVTEIWRIDFN